MKKPSMSSFSFRITLLLVVAVCIQGQEPVKDSDGRSIEIGQQYFIQPVKPESQSKSGLTTASWPEPPCFKFCPLGIARTFGQGIPVSFAYPVLEPVVKTSTDVTIEFKSHVWPVCNFLSKLWEADESSIRLRGNPECQNSFFKIEKSGPEADTYKLTTLTGTVGEDQRLSVPELVITNDEAKTLLVKFIKADDVLSTNQVKIISPHNATMATTCTNQVKII